MEALGVPAGQRSAAYAGLDKLLRAGEEAAAAELRKAGIEAGTAETLVRAVGRRDLAGLRTELGSTGVDLDVEVVRLERLGSYLDAYGIRSFCQFDAAIVRGLAYYTGVVFEMYDRAGELRALCGGGRFDDLLRAAGGEDLPAVGFGLGEAVLLELLAERDRIPELGIGLDAFVIPVTADDRPAAIRAATRLRDEGLRADLALKDQSIGKGLKRADQAGARAAVVIGSEERDSGVVTVRDLRSGAETKLDPDGLVAWLRDRRDD